jgi:hypothetical protein
MYTRSAERSSASLKGTAEPMVSPAVSAPSLCRKAAGRRHPTLALPDVTNEFAA